MTKKGGESVSLPHLRQFQVALVVLLVLTVLLATRPSLSLLDTALIRAIHRWPSSLRSFFLVITQLGSVWAVLLLGAWSLVEIKFISAMRILVACASNFVVIELLKHIVARPRPYQLLPGITRGDPLTAGGYGFPSGHAAMAALLVFILMVRLPKKYWPALLSGALLIGLSRIYLGMHSPLDIIGGFAVGSLTGSYFFGRELLAKTAAKA